MTLLFKRVLDAVVNYIHSVYLVIMDKTHKEASIVSVLRSKFSTKYVK